MDIDFKYFNNQDTFLKYTNNKKSKYLIFVASKTNIMLDNFNQQNIEIYGAIFSHIIYKNRVYDEGLISIEISKGINLDFIENISDYNFDNSSFSESKSIITIFNGFSKYNETLFVKLFENIPINTNIMGGGAGIIEDTTKKVLFNNKGFFLDSAIILSLNEKIKIASKHGWEHLSGPFIVTSSENNLLKSIDYMDAFELYKNEIKKDCGLDITKENFLEISKNYPIGIVKYSDKNIARDLISFENGNLVLVTNVKVNSIINILKGKKEVLINAAREAAKEVSDENNSLAIVFNCITRKNFLEEKFEEELDALYSEVKTDNMIGVTTIGEIANSGNRYITLLNKTCVIGTI